ncbi:hypothetical protein GEV33_012641 [Tenebrio molitor]|uniref:Reverse transcriptase domain-containing protein n=1 Tax=Tenebrio molitor TaxID=7067 RepID=A0A8J6H8R3_TENMO|nr:hypothetical protein GEV33_012641 [Tenebrio molitor]
MDQTTTQPPPPNRFNRPHRDDDILTDEILPDEVEAHIKRLKNRKAPGPDELRPPIFKHLPWIAIEALTNIFNNCLQGHHFPPAWKHATTIMIPKPGKDLSDPNHTFGFRSQRSTINPILEFHTDSTRHAYLKECTLAVFLDIERAFDRVWHDGLIQKLISLRLNPNFIKIIDSFLANRTCSVKIQNFKSIPIQLHAGTVCRRHSHMDKPKEPIDRQKDPPRPHGGNRNLDQLLTINLTKFLRHRMVDIETPCRRRRDAPPPSRSPPAHPTTTATTNISTQCSPRPTARRTTTHRVHLEPDKQHHDETTPSGGGSTSSGAQHTPDDQCDTKCFSRAETIHTDSQVHSLIATQYCMGKKLAEDSIQGINNVDDQDWTNYTPDMLRIAYRIFDKEKPVPGPEKKKWSQVAEAKLRFIKLQTEAVEAELQWKKEEQEAKTKCMLEMHVILSPANCIILSHATCFFVLNSSAFSEGSPKKNKMFRTKKSTIYIDTPEKEAIRQENEEKENRLKAHKEKEDITPPSSDEREYFCLVWVTAIFENRAGEKWIKC